MAMPSASHSSNDGHGQEGIQTPGEDETRRETEVEQHEGYQYWGYLFKSDKTGTDKLKSLLRGLKDVMVCEGVLQC